MESKKHYFPQLTGTRILAAYLVYIYHVSPFYGNGYLSNFQFTSNSWLLFIKGCIDDFGGTGVTLFFVLSGFLITYRYNDSGYWSKPKAFYNYAVNRAARIYPTYFILTTLTFIVIYYAHDPHATFLIYIYNITFIRAFFDEIKLSGIGQGWSLTVEECFYFLAPLIFLSIKRIKLFLQPLLLVLIGVAIVNIFGSTKHFGFMPDFQFMMKFTFFGRCFEFYVGIYVAILFNKARLAGKVNRTGSLYTYLGVFLVILSITCISLTAYLKSEIIVLFFNSFLLSAGIGTFFWGLLTEASIIRRLFSTPLFQLLGKSSYVFYLIHAGIIKHFVADILPGRSISMSILTFVIINIIAIILYLSLEKPLNGFIKKVLLKKKEGAELAVS